METRVESSQEYNCYGNWLPCTWGNAITWFCLQSHNSFWLRCRFASFHDDVDEPPSSSLHGTTSTTLSTTTTAHTHNLHPSQNWLFYLFRNILYHARVYVGLHIRAAKHTDTRFEHVSLMSIPTSLHPSTTIINHDEDCWTTIRIPNAHPLTSPQTGTVSLWWLNSDRRRRGWRYLPSIPI